MLGYALKRLAALIPVLIGLTVIVFAIMASIPESATIDRSEATLEVFYEGEPQFSPIPGTPGMLSEASPQRPRMSTTWSARTRLNSFVISAPPVCAMTSVP